MSKRNKAITIVIADENVMACQLLGSSLQRISSFKVVGCTTTSGQTLQLLKSTSVQVALIGTNLTDGPLSGFNLLRDIRLAHPDTRIILLLDCLERELVVQAFRGGARGLFSRSQSFRMLCKCICRVHEGQIWASSDHLQFMLEALAQAAPLHIVNANGSALLSKREEDVVALVAQGLTNRQIAQQLKLSEHTVKNYLFRIFDKLGVFGRIELVLYALNRRDLGNSGSRSTTA